MAFLVLMSYMSERMDSRLHGNDSLSVVYLRFLRIAIYK